MGFVRLTVKLTELALPVYARAQLASFPNEKTDRENVPRENRVHDETAPARGWAISCAALAPVRLSESCASRTGPPKRTKIPEPRISSPSATPTATRRRLWPAPPRKPLLRAHEEAVRPCIPRLEVRTCCVSDDPIVPSRHLQRPRVQLQGPLLRQA